MEGALPDGGCRKGCSAVVVTLEQRWALILGKEESPKRDSQCEGSALGHMQAW